MTIATQLILIVGQQVTPGKKEREGEVSTECLVGEPLQNLFDQTNN